MYVFTKSWKSMLVAYRVITELTEFLQTANIITAIYSTNLSIVFILLTALLKAYWWPAWINISEALRFLGHQQKVSVTVCDNVTYHRLWVSNYCMYRSRCINCRTASIPEVLIVTTTVCAVV